MDTLDPGTYNPHLEDCYFCHAEWTEDNKPEVWYEHYVCHACNPRNREKGS